MSEVPLYEARSDRETFINTSMNTISAPPCALYALRPVGFRAHNLFRCTNGDRGIDCPYPGTSLIKSPPPPSPGPPQGHR